MLGLKAKYDAAQYEGESYQYDINGNRLNHRIGGNNQLLNDGKEEYQYDAEGNRIAKGDVKYEWDHRNRLVKVVSPSKTIEYTYDYQNRLVSRKTEKGKEYFVHDGWQIVLILNGNGSVKERLLWGTKQDELLCENDNWTLGDHLNTIREVVDVNGKVMSHYDYNAFEKRLNVSSDTLSFAYTGKMTDSATNLQWNINRWYDANVGRWISEDPIWFVGKDENLYRYVGNTSLCLIDAWGFAPSRIFQEAFFVDLLSAYIRKCLVGASTLNNPSGTNININRILRRFNNPEVYLTNLNTGIVWEKDVTKNKMRTERDKINKIFCNDKSKRSLSSGTTPIELQYNNEPKNWLDWILGTSELRYTAQAAASITDNDGLWITINWKFDDDINAKTYQEMKDSGGFAVTGITRLVNILEVVVSIVGDQALAAEFPISSTRKEYYEIKCQCKK